MRWIPERDSSLIFCVFWVRQLSVEKKDAATIWVISSRPVPAGWSPQMVVNSKGIPPQKALDSGLGIIWPEWLVLPCCAMVGDVQDLQFWLALPKNERAEYRMRFHKYDQQQATKKDTKTSYKKTNL